MGIDTQIPMGIIVSIGPTHGAQRKERAVEQVETKVDVLAVTSPRLEILRRSLARKQAALDAKISEHFASVKAANGQPLNDKRNGAATLSKWDRQNESIRRMADGIEKTKAAIEREESAIRRVAGVSGALPAPVSDAVTSGLLQQWRKHPKTFFVAGVDKARIVLLDDGRLAHRYVTSITCADQRRIFAQTYNRLSHEVAALARIGGGK